MLSETSKKPKGFTTQQFLKSMLMLMGIGYTLNCIFWMLSQLASDTHSPDSSSSTTALAKMVYVGCQLITLACTGRTSQSGQLALSHQTPKVNSLGNQIIQASSCTAGLLALGSGQPIIQFIGSPLLTNCFTFPGVMAAQTNMKFLTTVAIGGPGNLVGRSAQQTDDGGFIVTGYAEGLGAGNKDVLLIKLLSNGTLSWAKTMGGGTADQGYFVQKTSDGGFIVTGEVNLGAADYDLLLAKFFANGTLSWSKRLGGISADYGKAVQQTQDGGFIVTGETASFGVGFHDVLLAKFLADGSLSWTKTLGGTTGNDYGRAVQQTQDGGFIVIGETSSFGAGNSDLLLAKFFANGTLSWSKILSGTLSEAGYAVQQTQDSGFIVTGSTDSFGAGSADVLLAKFFENGTLSWSKALGGTGNDIGRAVQQTQDGGFIITGYTTNAAGNGDILLAKVNLTGGLSWAEILGGTGEDWGYSIQKTQDGGFVMTGVMGTNLLIAKLDANGRNCNATQSINLIVTDITGLTVASITPTVTTPSPAVSDWGSAVAQNLAQNTICIEKTKTQTRSLSILETPTFLTTVGGVGDDIGFSAQQTSDGGFIVVGYTNSSGAGDYDLLLTKFASNGTVSWTKTVGAGASDYGYSIQKTQDGGYIVTGATNGPPSAGGKDISLAKFFSNGTLSWAKTFGGAGNEYGYSVGLTQNDGYVVTGYTYSFGTGGGDVILANLASNGTLIWVRTLGAPTGASKDEGRDVQQTQDDGYIVVGSTASYGAGSNDVLLAKFFSSGTLSWTTTLGGSGDEQGLTVQQTQDGGYIVTGATNSFGAGSSDVLLAKFNSTGALSWAKTLGGTGVDVGQDVQQTQDGGFIVLGYTASFGAGSNDVLLAKFNSTGGLSWAKTLGKNSSDVGYSIQQTQDGGFVVVGQIGADILLTKLNANGHILNCNYIQSINPTVTDITGSVTVTSPSPIVTAPSPTVSDWAVSAVAQNLTQNMTCPGKTRTQTRSLSILETPTFLTTVSVGSAVGNNEYGVSAQLTQDGGFIATGWVNGIGAGSDDLVLIKFASNGMASWTKTVGGANEEFGTYVQQTLDNGYIVTGYTKSSGAGDNDLLLIKFASNGAVSWAKTLGGPNSEHGTYVQQTQDGGYIVVGSTGSFGGGTGNALLTKFFSNGTLSWAKTLGDGGSTTRGYSTQQTQDGGYLISGYTYMGGGENVLLAKFTSNGTLSWTKTLDVISTSDNAESIRATRDGGFIVAGGYANSGYTAYHGLLAKFNSTGDLSWARNLSDISATRVQQTQDGGYVVVGATSFGAGGKDISLAKFFPNGTLSWAKALGGTTHDRGWSIQQTHDAGFVLAGTSASGSHILLAKLDQNGDIARCTAVQTINPTVTNITGLVTITSPSPIITTPNPTVNDWAVSAVSQNLNQNMTCPEKTRTQTRSLSILETPTFLTTVSGTGNDYGQSAQQTSDGGFIVAGYTNSVGAGSNDLLLIKFASNGTVSWIKTVGGTGDDYGYSVQQTQDGGFIVTGQTSSFGVGTYNLILAKFNSTGDSSWIKTVGGVSNDGGNSIQQTLDGEYIVTGQIASFGAGGFDVLLIKFNSTGGVSWATTLGGANNDIGNFVQQTIDGGYIVVGTTTSYGIGSNDILLAKFTPTGNLSWTKVVGGTSTEQGNAVRQTQDSGFIVVGTTTGFGAGNNDVLLAKFNSTGALSWAKTLGGTGDDRGYAIQQTQDDGFIITGTTISFGAGSNDVLLAKFFSNGTLSWAKTLGGSGSEVSYSVQKTQDGGFVITGTSGSNDILLAKFDPNGNIAHCDAMKVINPTVTDITGLITVTDTNPAITTPSPTVLDWSVSAISRNLNQTMLCPKRSKTASDTMSMTHSRSFSLSNRSSLSASQSSSPSHSFFKSRSQSALASSSKNLTESLSKQIVKTRTPQPTRTQPIRRSTSVLIQQFNLPITGITQTQISPSGSLVLTQTSTGFKLVKVSNDGTMTPAGQFPTSGTTQATTFSRDEKYLFVANDQGNIQIIDLRDPNNPKSIGFVPAGTSIQSLAISGDGTQLLVGTDTGVKVLSATTPADPKTMTLVTSYVTPNPVKTIQTNPNTNIVSIGSGNDVTLLDFVNNKFTQLDQKTLSSPIKTILPTDQADPTQLTVTLNNGDTVFMNIANPKATVVVSTIPGSSTELTAVSGTTLLVAGVKPGIQIFENTQKNWQAAPEAGYTPVSGPVTSLSFSSDGKFGIYSDAQGLKLIKVIKDPGRLDVPLPRLLTVVDLGVAIRDVLLNEENNWIALGSNQLIFISRDNLKHPTILGIFNTTGSVSQMILFPDKTKLLLVDDAGVACIDCFNPQAPRLLGRWNTKETIYGLTLSGSHAYVCQGEMGIAILDITNPSSIVKKTMLSTQGSAHSIRFNSDRSLSFVADGSGVDILSVQTALSFQHISRFNTTELVSAITLSSDEKTLYFVGEQLLGQVNVSDSSKPTLTNRLDASRPIKDILLSNQGSVAYLADETAGMLVVNTKTMQIKGQLAGTAVNAMALTEFEDQIYVADMNGGLKVAELISELPIIPITARTSYPVGIRVEETLLFFDKKLNPATIDRINSIQYVDNGQKRDLPLWISSDLAQRKISITAPKELTDKPVQLAVSVDINGVRQETLYQTQVSSSLEIDSDKGVVIITTPSPTVSVNVNLTQGSFIPQSSGSLSVSTKDNILQAFGPVDDINNYLQSVRINPNPIALNQSAVALNPAQIKAADIINLVPSNAIVRLRNFRFNQAPVVANSMNKTNQKALDSFEIDVPSNTFTDADDPKLTLSAQLVNGTQLPAWLTFNPDTAEFTGEAPASMLNKSLRIKLTASDGYLSVNSTWELHIDANKGPFVAKPIPSLTRSSGSEFSYALPQGIFQDLDNDTLVYTAVQNGYDVLPGFLNFNPDTQTFLGRPTGGDVSTYTIKVTATDKFGASAQATFDMNIKFSNWDFFLYVLEKCGIATAIATPFTWAYFSRSFIYNTVKRAKYWRNEVPRDLLEGKGYKPKHPETGEEIEKDDIVKIHIMAFDSEKCGHTFARDTLPIHFYVGLYAKPLLNDEPLPTWMELNPDTGTLQLKQEHFPTGNSTYIYQVMGENGYILESFFINPSHISMYQAPVNLAQMPSFDLDPSIELDPIKKPDGIVVPNCFLDDTELEALLDQRPCAAAAAAAASDTPEVDAALLLPAVENPPPVAIQAPVSIEEKHLLSENSSALFSPASRNNQPTPEQQDPLIDGKWVIPGKTKELENALSMRHNDSRNFNHTF